MNVMEKGQSQGISSPLRPSCIFGAIRKPPPLSLAVIVVLHCDVFSRLVSGTQSGSLLPTPNNVHMRPTKWVDLVGNINMSPTQCVDMIGILGDLNKSRQKYRNLRCSCLNA